MPQTLLKIDHQVGSLPRRLNPRFARLIRSIRRADPQLAEAILAEIAVAQQAERRARLLLARYRIMRRRVPILKFPKRA
jgi:hypothetical protein